MVVWQICHGIHWEIHGSLAAFAAAVAEGKAGMCSMEGLEFDDAPALVAASRLGLSLACLSLVGSLLFVELAAHSCCSSAKTVTR